MRIHLDEPEHKMALEEATKSVEEYHEFKMPFGAAQALVEEFLWWLDSQDRDFSDEMLQARKTFKKLCDEQPDECPSKLFEDVLRSIGRM
ncbi:MAG: hypothetical protein AAAB13_20460 [Pseudomonas sp.]